MINETSSESTEDFEQDKHNSSIRRPLLHNTDDSLLNRLQIVIGHPLQDLDSQNLVTTVENLQKELNHLEVENVVLVHFLEKNDPATVENMQSYIKQSQEKSTSYSRRSSVFSRASRRSSVLSESFFEPDLGPSAPSHVHEMPKINLAQRTDLVLREMDEVQAEIEAERKKAHDVKFNFNARIEELEIRKAEVEESLENIEKFRQAHEVITLEKYVRFMEEWSRKSRLMVDKIRLRYSSLKVQYQKLTATLAQKLLIGENLQEIDFEQLRIENLHLAEKSEKIAILLLELKRMTGAGNLQLSQHKKRLQIKIKEKEEIQKAIEKKEKEIAKSDDEITKLGEEVRNVRNEYEKIKMLVSYYKAPDVLDYIKTKAELDELNRELKVWTRRKRFKDMALNTALMEMKRLLGGRQPNPDWFL